MLDEVVPGQVVAYGDFDSNPKGAALCLADMGVTSHTTNIGRCPRASSSGDPAPRASRSDPSLADLGLQESPLEPSRADPQRILTRHSGVARRRCGSRPRVFSDDS